MEITGVGEAAQFVQVSFAGAETVLKLSGSFTAWSIEQLKSLIILLFHGIEKVRNHKRQLAKGEVSIDKMLKYCDKNRERAAIMQIDERIKDDFIKFCDDNKLTYSFLTDVNKDDGKVEIMYRSGQRVVFEAFIMSHPELASAYSLKDYVSNMSQEDFLEAYEELSQDGKDIAANIQHGDLEGFSYSSRYDNVKDITISMELVAGETADVYKTRVPGMYGRNAGYILVNKNDARLIHDGKTIHTYLVQDEKYAIYDANNDIKDTMFGQELYAGHYDPVRVRGKKNNSPDRPERENRVRSSPQKVENHTKTTLPKSAVADYNVEKKSIKRGDLEGYSYSARYDNVKDITISMELVADETKDAYRTRVPGMYGKNAGYILVNKNDARIIHDGKTIHTYLVQDRNYTIYDANNNIKETMSGQKLYAGHYDPVRVSGKKNNSPDRPERDNRVRSSQKKSENYTKITLSKSEITDYNAEKMRIHLGDYNGNSFYTDLNISDCYFIQDSQDMIVNLDKEKVNVCLTPKMNGDEHNYTYNTASVINLVAYNKRNIQAEAAKREMGGKPEKVTSFMYKDKDNNIIKADFARKEPVKAKVTHEPVIRR